MTIFDKIQILLKDIPSVRLLELGACDGNETVRFITMFPDARIVALEPVPELANITRGRKELKNKVSVYQMAIGSQDGETDLYVSSGKCETSGQDFYASSSIKEPLNAETVFKGMKFYQSKCKVITLDTLWNMEGCGIIDFIWADIQGAENDMILGGKNALEYTRYLYTEVDLGNYYSGSAQAKELLDMLPNWEVVEDYGTDILLKNTKFA